MDQINCGSSCTSKSFAANPSKFDIVLDYGVSVVAYIWRALQLGIKSYLDAKDGLAAKDFEVQDDPQLI